MAVATNTVETYDNVLLNREDLQEAYSMLSPEEVPFHDSIGARDVDSSRFDWPTLELAAPATDNRVPEGEDGPAVDAPTLGTKWSNFTQISDKVVSVSHSAQATDASAEDVHRLMSQVSLKLRELRREVEQMLLQNIAADPGAAEGTARVTAGLAAWIDTNVIDGGGTAADPAFSGTTHGYPDTAAVIGTPAPIDEDKFNDLIEQCWKAGANPTMALVHGANKRVISKTFTGNSTRYQPAPEKEVYNAIDFYDSDFGRITIVPTRFMLPLDAPSGSTSWPVFLIDPDYAKVAYLDKFQRKPLAETGHSVKMLVWGEYGLQVDNKDAFGIYRDTNGLAA